MIEEDIDLNFRTYSSKNGPSSRKHSRSDDKLRDFPRYAKKRLINLLRLKLGDDFVVSLLEREASSL